MFLFSPKFDWIFSHLPRFNWSCCTSPKCAYFTQIFLILLKTLLKLFSWPKFDESCWNYHMIPVNARAVSILPGTGLFGLSRFGLADLVWPIRSGRFGHGTFWSDYEILQKSYINAKTSRLIESALPPSSYCRLPKVEAFHSKRTPFTIRNGGKRCRQGSLLGIKFLAVVQSSWISGVSGLASLWLRFIIL